jgi:hypothetical protein
MTAGEHNITIEQGATFTLPISVTRNGNPWDLTDYTIRMQVRKKFTSTSTEVELTEANKRVVRGTGSHQFTLTISATDTAKLTFDTCRYDLEIEDEDGIVTRLLEGLVYLNKEVTR